MRATEFQQDEADEVAQDEGLDLVLSYPVTSAGTEPKHLKKLEEALAKGYRVMDVFTNSVDGTGGGNGFVTVTVLLQSSESKRSPYAQWKRNV